MTIDEFLAVLRAQASAQRWILGTIAVAPRQGGIRTDTNLYERQCPITFVGNKPLLHQTYRAGRELGLSRAAIVQITHAADEEPGHDPALRQALLEAVGLVEEATP